MLRVVRVELGLELVLQRHDGGPFVGVADERSDGRKAQGKDREDDDRSGGGDERDAVMGDCLHSHEINWPGLRVERLMVEG